MEQRSYDAFQLLLPVLRAKAAKSTILINDVFVGPDRRFVSATEAAAIKEGVEYLRKARRRLIEAKKEADRKQTRSCKGATKWQPNPRRRQQLLRQLQQQQHHHQQQQQFCTPVNDERERQKQSQVKTEAQELVGVEYLKKARRRLVEAKKEAERKQTQSYKGATKWQPNPRKRQQLLRQLLLQQQLAHKATLEKQHLQQQQKQQKLQQQQQQHQQQQQKICAYVNEEKENEKQTQDEAEAQKLVAIKDANEAKVEEADLRAKVLNSKVLAVKTESEKKCHDCSLLIAIFSFR